MSVSAHPSDRFGQFGGKYVPETLMPALDELEEAYATAQNDASFRAELSTLLSTYVGRPSPVSEAPRLSERSTTTWSWLQPVKTVSSAPMPRCSTFWSWT